MADPKPSPDRLISVSMGASVLVIGLVLLLGAWLRLGIIGGEQWPIEWLEVSGSLERTSASQVRAAAAPYASNGFFATDLAQVRQAVEALPWVAKAKVSRQFSDTLIIELQEHTPLARWNERSMLSGLSGQGGAVLSIDGFVCLAPMASTMK